MPFKCRQLAIIISCSSYMPVTNKYLREVHYKNKLVVLTTEWLPWFQTKWRDSGYEKFALVSETNCIRQPKGQVPSSSYNHNTLKTLITSVLPSPPSYKFLTATMKCICNMTPSLSVLWCKMNWTAPIGLPYAISALCG